MQSGPRALRSRSPRYQEHRLPPMQGGCSGCWAGPGYVRSNSGTLGCPALHRRAKNRALSPAVNSPRP